MLVDGLYIRVLDRTLKRGRREPTLVFPRVVERDCS